MRITAIGLVALCGCVTTQPQSIGRDTYMVETMGTNMTFGPALRRATAFCADQGKKVQLMTANKSGMGAGANASVTFMCLDESDPRYKSPVIRRDNGVSTTENR